jgi:serine/threonine-protein kinase
MPIASVASLIEALRQRQLLGPAQLEEVANHLQLLFPEPRALARELVQRGWLTPYQVNQLFLGRDQGLVLGNYVLLERLGEGGMGAVFKARHVKLGRVVALKLIRKERLDNPDFVRRFHREVQAAAQLTHPNIVLAYDADQAGDAHFLAMELVEGTDLGKVVKQHGPLPVAAACDYVRQAALGLQHAFEKGLVHRDIKPANLLLTVNGVVKVLDLGLARLASVESFLEPSTTLTQEGAVMGTPDFIAPEQARDSHSADIRADIYSLGCTLYFLLTGKVPFPGGSLTEKLLKHQLDAPRPLRGLRAEVPPAVAAVVDKLMAKRPEDRYQSPAEVAAALVAARTTEHELAAREDQGAKRAQQAVTSSNPFAGLREDSVAGPTGEARALSPNWRLLLAGVVGLVVVALLGLGAWRMSAGRPRAPGPEEAGTRPTPPKAIVDKANDRSIDRLKPKDKEDVKSVPPPPGAVVLFDGKNLEGWAKRPGKAPAHWKLVPGGAVEVVRGGDIVTKQRFGGKYKLHVEFRVPYLPEAKGQARGNSGVFVQGRYEVQVLDSYGLDSKHDDCGAIYGVAAPKVNACKAPTIWQSYDIEFTTAKTAGGKIVAPARITVYHNGVKIHDDVRITREHTPGAMSSKELGGDPGTPGPILLQDHVNPVQYRNIWLLPLK